MTPHSASSPKNVCESLLIEEKRYNAEHCILPSESAVADRLLGRGLEMTPAYEELYTPTARSLKQPIQLPQNFVI